MAIWNHDIPPSYEPIKVKCPYCGKMEDCNLPIERDDKEEFYHKCIGCEMTFVFFEDEGGDIDTDILEDELRDQGIIDLDKMFQHND